MESGALPPLESCLLLEARGLILLAYSLIPSTGSRTLGSGVSLCLELPMGAFAGFPLQGNTWLLQPRHRLPTPRAGSHLIPKRDTMPSQTLSQPSTTCLSMEISRIY